MHFNDKTIQRTFIVVLHTHTNQSTNFTLFKRNCSANIEKTRRNRSSFIMLLNGTLMDHLMLTSS